MIKQVHGMTWSGGNRNREDGKAVTNMTQKNLHSLVTNRLDFGLRERKDTLMSSSEKQLG